MTGFGVDLGAMGQAIKGINDTVATLKGFAPLGGHFTTTTAAFGFICPDEDECGDEVLAGYGLPRQQPDMTVDSEAIFALMELRRHDPRALGELRGAMAAAWLDEREPDTLFLARGVARPLWIGRTRTELFFASTRRALAIVEAALRLRLELREAREGRLVHVVGGRVVRQRRFRPDRTYQEDAVLPPVRAPHEAVSCLERLAAITAAAA